MKILILGGYGTFGGRLAHLLAREERLTLFLAGRSIQKAKKFSDGLPSGAQKVPVFFDRNANVEAQIREIRPDLVVDAMGPFQVYGEDPYRVVKACIANGVDYMDLADGSDFVKGIRQFDQGAKEKNIHILSGVSSFPVLTAAVVRKLSHDMTCVTTIKGGIAPSPYAGVGLNVIRAIASYAGKPVSMVRNGKPATGYALTETMRYTICPPGHLPLKNTLFSLFQYQCHPEYHRVETGKHPVARLLAALYGLPRTGEHVPVKVSFQRRDGGELWQRDFAGRKFSTFQWEGHGYADKRLLEKFGPVIFWMALVLKQGELHYVTRRWSVFGIPLPLVFAPSASAYEFADGDDFCFHVEVKHWLMGLIVRYEGKLAPLK